MKNIAERIEKHSSNRFKIQRILGQGSYGVVFSAIEKESGKEFALKFMERFFNNILDTKKVLREICLLKNVNHPNIIKMHEILRFNDECNPLTFVFDLMDTDLGQIIRSNQKLMIDHHKFLLYQVLKGLKYLHSANIIHRDIKPSNLLVNGDCNLKIADFGFSIINGITDTELLFEEAIATLWYRSPELLLNFRTYGPAIDIWSVGCVLAELISSKPLFPGKSSMNQLTMIVDVLGNPTSNDMKNCDNNAAKRFMDSLPRKRPVPFSQLFPEAHSHELDLLEKMLKWDPSSRITVEEALRHPFFSSLHDPFDEPVTLPLNEFDFERKDVTMEELKFRIIREVRQYQ